jgi:hypothetical protein
MGYEIVETDSGWSARPKGSGLTIGMNGTLQGYKTLASLRESIKLKSDLAQEVTA